MNFIVPEEEQDEHEKNHCAIETKWQVEGSVFPEGSAFHFVLYSHQA
jgi:hypothetical protein